MNAEQNPRPGSTELLAVFEAETARRLDTMERVLAELQQRLEASDPEVARLLGAVIQHEAHTIKGGAAVTGLEQARAAAAELETLGRSLQQGAAPSDEALARARTLLHELRRGADPQPLAAAASEPVDSAPALGAVGLRIVCVDDDGACRLVLERLLSGRPGTQVWTAGDGQAGLDLIRRHRPQLVFCDLRLPGFDGAELLARIQADPATHRIPVVVTSGDPAEMQAARLKAAGAAAYLEKPLDLRSVLELVERLEPGVSS